MQNAETNLTKECDKNKHIREVMENINTTVKLALIRNVRDILDILIYSLLNDEISEKIGAKYMHNKKERNLYRWGTNSGSVGIGQERVKINVPRST